MKRTILVLLLLLLPCLTAGAQSAFPYYGKLIINGSAVTGTYDFQFTLYNAVSGGTLVGSGITKSNVSVNSGNYTVTLDFGSGSFSSPPLFMQIAYRKSGTSTWLSISGRTQTSIRFSVVAVSAMGLQGKPVAATIPSSGQVLKWNGTQWAPAADLGGTSYSAGAGLALASGVFSIAAGGVAASMIANGAVTGQKIAWPLSYSASANSTHLSLTNGGSGSGIYAKGGASGVTGESVTQTGVKGISTDSYGVHGKSENGAGVYGYSEKYHGVRGESPSGVGVVGIGPANIGVWGQSTSGPGVRGESNTHYGVAGYSSSNVGVYGFSVSGYAGYFTGGQGLYASSASASIKQFEIDHPLDPTNKYLRHSCVESNERLNVYTGNVTTDANGVATIALPDWFEALNTDFRYQLTVVGQFAQAIIGSKIASGRFTIRTSLPQVEVSWQVSGVRKDAYAAAHPLQVEQLKPDNERGTFLNPIEHGAPETLRTPRGKTPSP